TDVAFLCSFVKVLIFRSLLISHFLSAIRFIKIMATTTLIRCDVNPLLRPQLLYKKRSSFARPCFARCRTVPKSRTVIRAELRDPFRNVQAAFNSLLKRYDILSTGLGAIVVTSYCVYVHGQDPLTALSITFTATVIALVANELLFDYH
ncbi:hypothetical protein Vafri_5087, partial [Volvox africanus]